MRRSVFIILLTLVTGALLGCAAAVQPLPQPTPARTIPPLPTPIVVTLPSPGAATPAATTGAAATSVAQPSPEGGTVIVDATLLKLVNEAKADLTTRANVPVDAITVKSAQPTEWRDSSLGCPQEGNMYSQVITPGYLIVLEANGQEYNYHASMESVTWCEN